VKPSILLITGKGCAPRRSPSIEEDPGTDRWTPGSSSLPDSFFKSKKPFQYQRAFTLYEKIYGPEHPSISRVQYHIARLYRREGRYAEATILYQKVLSLQENTQGSEHPRTIKTREDLTDLLNEMRLDTENIP
jgi:tetratricopeptide (TPR) repeat protein